MASKAQVVLRGRFPKGTVVALVKVEHEGILRSEGGELVDTKKVDDEGVVTFASKVEEGSRYFIRGYVRGELVEVRATGRSESDQSSVLSQAPVQPDRLRYTDGTFEDDVPEKVAKKDLPKFEAAPNLSQRQVGDDVPQRSSTLRGSAHPVDPDEPTPYLSQSDVPEGTPQMSDTPDGQATPISVGPQRQEDVPEGTWQRSDTPTGTPTIIPSGGPVAAQQEKESSEGKTRRGQPVRVAAEPLDPSKPVKGASEKQSDKREAQVAKDREAAAEPVEPVEPQPPEAKGKSKK
jgi:hypothetical protein